MRPFNEKIASNERKEKKRKQTFNPIYYHKGTCVRGSQFKKKIRKKEKHTKQSVLNDVKMAKKRVKCNTAGMEIKFTFHHNGLLRASAKNKKSTNADGN